MSVMIKETKGGEMAECEFQFDHNEDPKSVYDRAKSALKNIGGEISGDQNAGEFVVSKFGMTMEGRFEVKENEVKLYIDKKPFLISCQQIKDVIGSKFS